MKASRLFKLSAATLTGGLVLTSSLLINSSCSSQAKVISINMSNSGILTDNYALYTVNVHTTSTQERPIETYTSTGKKVDAKYSITPQLPNGLEFNKNTGVISGTPLVELPKTKYQITAKYLNFTDDEYIFVEVDPAGSYITLGASTLTGWNLTTGNITFWYTASADGQNNFCRIYDGNGKINPTTSTPTTPCGANDLTIKDTITFTPAGISSMPITCNVVGVEQNAFSNNVNIKNTLNFPQSNTTDFHISAGAFSGCVNIAKEIKFPKKLSTMGANAFTSVGYNSTNDNFVKLSFDKTNSTIWDIPDQCFNDARLGNLYGGSVRTDIQLPSSIKEIGQRAFANSQIYGNVVFNEGLLMIRSFAFTGFGNFTVAQNGDMRMKDIVLPESLTNLGEGAFYWSTFQDDDGLTNHLTIGANLRYVSRRAFALLSIESVKLHTSENNLDNWSGGSGNNNAIFWDWKSFAHSGSHHTKTNVTCTYNALPKLKAISHECPEWHVFIF